MKNKIAVWTWIATAVIVVGIAAFFVIKQLNKESAPTDSFVFGPQAHEPQPKTTDEFIPLFAEQLKRYNAIAPQLWPGNAVTDKLVVLEDVGSKRLWQITPNGETTPLTESEAEDMGISRSSRASDFSVFDGGMYISMSDEDLNDQARWGKYIYLGTYDAIIWLIHEGFHSFEQSKWAKPAGDVANSDRNEYLENTASRAARALLQKQLLKAIENPGDKQLVLAALATYADWKARFPDELRDSEYFDRIEGTAYYYEIVACLYTSYPDQINSSDDLSRALTALAARGEDVYSAYGLGLVSEGYTVGAFACVLLDRVKDKYNWKEQIMGGPDLTPIELLLQRYGNETLPQPEQLAKDEMAALEKKILDQLIHLYELKRQKLIEMADLLNTLPQETRDEFVSGILADIDFLEKLIKERNPDYVAPPLPSADSSLTPSDAPSNADDDSANGAGSDDSQPADMEPSHPADSENGEDDANSSLSGDDASPASDAETSGGEDPASPVQPTAGDDTSPSTAPNATDDPSATSSPTDTAETSLPDSQTSSAPNGDDESPDLSSSEQPTSLPAAQEPIVGVWNPLDPGLYTSEDAQTAGQVLTDSMLIFSADGRFQLVLPNELLDTILYGEAEESMFNIVYGSWVKIDLAQESQGTSGADIVYRLTIPELAEFGALPMDFRIKDGLLSLAYEGYGEWFFTRMK